MNTKIKEKFWKGAFWLILYPEMKLSEQFTMSQVLQWLWHAHHEKNLMNRHISFWNDIAWPHTAHLTLGKTEKSGWKCSHILPTVRTWHLHTNHLLGSLKYHERASTTKTILQSSKPCIHSWKILKQTSNTQWNLKLVQHWQKCKDHCGDFMEQWQNISSNSRQYLFLYTNLCFNLKQVCSWFSVEPVRNRKQGNRFFSLLHIKRGPANHPMCVYTRYICKFSMLSH
jgi:hypothetical protein